MPTPGSIQRTTQKTAVIDLLELKTEIINLLSTEIGQYKFPDGGTGQAVAVLPDSDQAYNYPPAGTAAIGLEVIIQEQAPEVKSLLGNGIHKIYRTLIILKQWDSSQKLLPIIETLILGLPGKYTINKVLTMPPNDKLLTIEQAKIELIDHEAQY